VQPAGPATLQGVLRSIVYGRAVRISARSCRAGPFLPAEGARSLQGARLLIGPARNLEQDDGKIQLSRNIIRLQPQRSLILADLPPSATRGIEGVPKIDMRLGEIRFQNAAPSHIGRSLPGPAHGVQGVSRLLCASAKSGFRRSASSCSAIASPVLPSAFRMFPRPCALRGDRGFKRSASLYSAIASGTRPDLWRAMRGRNALPRSPVSAAAHSRERNRFRSPAPTCRAKPPERSVGRHNDRDWPAR